MSHAGTRYLLVLALVVLPGYDVIRGALDGSLAASTMHVGSGK